MNILKKLIEGIGTGIFLILFVPIMLACVIIVLPIVILHSLTVAVFRLIRRDPQPKFAKAAYIRDKTDNEKQVESSYQAAFKNAQDFIGKHVKNLKIETKKQQDKGQPVHTPADEKRDKRLIATHTNYTTVLTAKHRNALGVKLELDYSTGMLDTPESFEVYDDDEEDDNFTCVIEINSPIAGKDPIRLFLLEEKSQWLAIAALRGNVKVSKHKQIWFYFEEHAVWAVIYGNGYHAADIGYRKQFREQRTKRFSLR